MFTGSLLAEIARQPVTPFIDELAAEFSKQLPSSSINTKNRRAHFLSHCGVETWSFTRFEENLHYSVVTIQDDYPKLRARAIELAGNPEALANALYCGRYGNGDEASGDGWKFHGRGGLQITFRDNYAAIGEKLAIDLVDNPDLLLEAPMAVASAIAFWDMRKVNAAADRNDIVGSTELINGGQNGIIQRRLFRDRALEFLPV